MDRKIEITEALNGQQALDQVHSHQLPFDLILMDLHMPLMDGFEVSNHCILCVHHEVCCRLPRDSGRMMR
jgi:response regulator RpfG family c-di-GMP phosphodiesterase